MQVSPPTATGTTTATDELGDVCRALHRPLVGALTLYCGDAHVAEELAQEALIRLCQHWDRGVDDPPAWTYRVAFNLARSRFRRLASHRKAVRRLEAERPRTVEADDADVIAVRRALLALPDRQRQAIVLRYFADLGVREVAAQMSCPEGTVKTLCFQGIRSLRASGLEVDGD